MDIKFVGSGESAKAILYYITNYISKAQLKAHIAYAALEMAVRKLGEYNPWDDELTIRAKHMLQKCAYAMIAHQELSSQQVMSYLLDLEDHFTSHEFKNLFWTSFETAINSEDPSPECYQTSDVDNKDCLQDMRSNEEDQEIQHANEEANTSPDVDDELPPADVLEHDEIGISVGDADEILARSSQLTDYKCRSDALQSLTLWEFCAQMEKVKAVRVSENADLEDVTLDDILMFPNKTRPMYRFKTPHEECYTHALKIIHSTS